MTAAPHYSEWSEPVIAAEGGYGCPIESRDGNWLYTASGQAGTLDIWAWRRSGRTDTFSASAPVRLGPPVSLDDAADFCPTPLPGFWLMFVSDRSSEDACGESANADMYLTRFNPHKKTNTAEAIHLGCAPDGPNTPATELSPSLVTTSEGTELYYSSDVTGDQDLYMSTQAPDGSYSAGTPVAELNTGDDDRQPNVSRDGLIIVFASDRDAPGNLDIFMAVRDDVGDPWSAPVNLSATLGFPTQGVGESRPSLSGDLKRLYLGAGGTVYVSTRKPGK